MESYQKDLIEKGYAIIPGVLNQSEIDNYTRDFTHWKKTISDDFHKKVSPHGIFKYHEVGHQKFAWTIRLNKNVQNVFKKLWSTEELVVSFDGYCHIPKTWKNKDNIWTHCDQDGKIDDLECYQGFVSMTDNEERTFVVYEGSHKIQYTYLKEHKEQKIKELNAKLEDGSISEVFHTKELKKIKKNTAWNLIDHAYLREIEDQKRVLKVKKGDMVIWDSRAFHQNQYGKPESEERLVQYISFLPKNGKGNTESMKKKRRKYFNEKRTTSHWAYPIRVNGLQPQTYGDRSRMIDYESLPTIELDDLEEKIIELL